MSHNVVSCRTTDDIERALALMTLGRVRRLPVLDSNGAVAGILSKVDVARRLPPAEVKRTLAHITEGGQDHQAFRRAVPGLLALAGAAAGAALMYLLDPARGHARRALLNDKLAHVWRQAVYATESARNEVVNRTLGFAAETRARLQRTRVDDVVLVERVRARLGRVVSHPHDVAVAAEQGVVILAGRIPRVEIRKLVHMTEQVPGVARVVNELESAAYAEARHHHSTS